jgi:hypothetical protein
LNPNRWCVPQSPHFQGNPYLNSSRGTFTGLIFLNLKAAWWFVEEGGGNAEGAHGEGPCRGVRSKSKFKFPGAGRRHVAEVGALWLS